MPLTIDNKIFFKQLSTSASQKKLHLNNVAKVALIEIFAYLDLSSLSQFCQLSKSIQEVAKDKHVKRVWKRGIYQEIAFKNKDWIKHFGKELIQEEDEKKEFESLPAQVIEEYRRFKKVYPKKNAKKCLCLIRMPAAPDGPITLTKMGELAKKLFPEYENGFGYLSTPVETALLHHTLKGFQWCLWTGVLTRSRNKSFARQMRMAKGNLKGFDAPEVLVAGSCFLAQSAHSTLPPLRSFTRCKEQILGVHVTIGFFKPFFGFTPPGMNVSFHHFDNIKIGMAAVKNLEDTL